jgi:hypothetical protein
MMKKWKQGEPLPTGMVFDIEKCVPVPERPRKNYTPIRETLKRMAVGDSVHYRSDFGRNYIDVGAAKAAWYMAATVLDMRVMIRQMEDGFRVWRKG